MYRLALCLKWTVLQIRLLSFFVYKHINLLHQNINGLLSKSDLLTVALDNLQKDYNVKVDVLCITEHNMLACDSNILQLENFILGSIFSRKSRHGGACILVRNTHKFKQINEIKNSSIVNVIECTGIELLEHNIVVICIYRPPKSNLDDLSKFFNTLNTILSKHCYGKKKVIVCGDLNIDTLQSSRESNELLESVATFNLKLAINEPTRLKSGKCIDHLMHNVRGSIGKVHELALSDHTAQLLICPVKLSFSLKHWHIERRDYSPENIDKFVECINSLTFKEVFDCDNPNEAFDIFYELFLLFYYLCFPLVLIKISTQRKPKWISNGIRKCCKRKRQLLWEYRKNRSEDNKKKYKALSTRLNRIVKLTQKAQNDNHINNATNKCKATWDIINRHKTKIIKEEIAVIKHKNKTLNCPQDIANSFNDFFIDQIKLNTGTKPSTIPKQSTSLFMKPIMPVDIEYIIANLKNTDSTGYDDISTRVLKLVSCKISEPLSHIFNICITYGVFPDKLKHTIIKPLFKKDDKCDMNCYRPIALVPVLSKVFEKFIHASIYRFFENRNLFTDKQAGFRKNKSINMAIFDFLKNIMHNLDQNTIACALFMDLTKAFDHVEHQILLDKLDAYGVRGNVLSLIQSYLTNRTQSTEITRICTVDKKLVKYTSPFRTVKCGVPQGSVLGPLLFIIYINDIPAITNHHMTLFADDSTILFTGTNKTILECDINDTLKKTVNWLSANHLKINLSKTKLMIFKNRVTKINYIDINCNGQDIEQIQNTKFLGLNIDCNLNWKSHLELLCAKVARFSYALYMLSKTASESTLLTAYHGYVASLLRYGVLFWGNSTDKEVLFRAQKRCVRAICRLQQTDSCKPHFARLNILTLPSLYILEAVLFVRKNNSLFDAFKSIRHKHKLCCPKNRTAKLNSSIFCMATRLYNHLPESTLASPSNNIFKNNVKKLLNDKMYYSVNEYLSDKYD